MTPASAAARDTGGVVATVAFKRHEGRPKLDDLWLFSGSVCNLRCLHCYTGSSPDNGTYEFLERADAAQVLDEAAVHGVRDVYVTGGEPFANPSFAGWLDDALRVAPTTVLSNGTEPLYRSLARVRELATRHQGRLTFRISLDHYEPARHDAIRRSGTGARRDSFETTARTVDALSREGLTPIITFTAEVFRGNPVPEAYVEQRTKDLFSARGTRVEVKFLSAMIDQGSQRRRRDEPPRAPRLTEPYLRAQRIDRTGLMCHASRLVAKRGGRLHVYPCPVLVGSDASSVEELAPFDLGPSLTRSLEAEVPLAHPSCATYCCLGRASCANAR